MVENMCKIETTIPMGEQVITVITIAHFLISPSRSIIEWTSTMRGIHSASKVGYSTWLFPYYNIYLHPNGGVEALREIPPPPPPSPSQTSPPVCGLWHGIYGAWCHHDTHHADPLSCCGSGLAGGLSGGRSLFGSVRWWLATGPRKLERQSLKV